MTFYQDDATCHGEESQSLLEVSQQPELKPRGSDWRPPAIILGEPSCIKHVFAPLKFTTFFPEDHGTTDNQLV